MRLSRLGLTPLGTAEVATMGVRESYRAACGQPIPQARLEVMPYAVRCVACAEVP